MASKEQQKVPVSRRALMQRINRVLGKKEQALQATRGERARLELGDYYLVHLRAGGVLDKRVKPEALGRELGVLAPYEQLEED